MTTRAVLFVSLLAVASAAAAQTSPSPSAFQFARGATVDLAVPESPAFSALGVTPHEVSRPTSGRELATTLLNGSDRNGNLQTGIAVDTAPYMLIAASKLTLQAYRRGPYLTRFLARWLASFATAKGSGTNDQSVKLSLGTRFTIFDRGDPRMDAALLKCLAEAADLVLSTAPPVPPGADVNVVNGQREEAVRAAARPCREAAARRRWNRSAWIAGVAPTWTSPNGKAGHVEYSGTALWTSVGLGFEGVPVLEDHAMLAAYVKTRDGEIAPDPFKQGSLVKEDSLTAGARLLVGAASTQLNFEAVGVDNRRMDDRKDRFWRVGLGLEQRLVDHTWISLSFGRELARSETDNSMFVLGSLKWGLGDR